MARTVLVVVAALVLSAPSAEAITRAEAERTALTVLRPDQEAGSVRVFGFRRPLSARQSVDILTGKNKRVGRRRLGRRTWFYWEDLMHGAMFAHPSVLLLIDDRTGRVRLRRSLEWWPLIDARAPVFLRSGGAYTSGSHVVWAPPRGRRVHVPRGPPASPAQAQRTYAIRPEDLANDCLIAVGDRGDENARADMGRNLGMLPDLEQLEQFADRIGLRRIPAPRASARGLERAVARAVDRERCRDVFIFLTGHGVPPRGTISGMGRTSRSPGGRAGVAVNIRRTGRRARHEVEVEMVRPVDVERIIDANRSKATFKVKIQSCYAGRFYFALVDKPNVRVFELSSRADEASYFHRRVVRVNHPDGTVTEYQNDTDNRHGVGEFMNRNLHGLEAWASSPQEVEQTGRDLAAGINRSFDLGANQDFAARIGFTQPIRVFNPQVPAVPPGTGPAFDMTGAWRFFAGNPNEVEGEFRAGPGGAGSIDGARVVVPERSITNFLCPPQLPNGTLSGTNRSNDTLTCEGGSIPFGQAFGMNVRTSPPPAQGMGGQVFGHHEGRYKGPFAIRGP